MSNGIMKRRKEVRAVIELLGFECESIELGSGGHLKCHVIDDHGNSFTAFTGQSCSANTRNARLNFRQDVKRLSLRARGVLD